MLDSRSNVTGSVQPIENVKRRIVESGNEKTVLLLDAAQSLGHLPLDVEAIGCDILAAPGHKGILGPLGTGILYVAEHLSDQIRPLRFGGTGSSRSTEFQPTEVPQKFESGNLNVPGIAGINAGLKFLASDEGKLAHENQLRLSQLMLDGIASIDGVQLQGHSSTKNRIGVFSLSIDGFDCHEAAGIFESSASIQTRAGFHCAPLLHRALGTEAAGGTVRISPGFFNTASDIEAVLKVISEIAS